MKAKTLVDLALGLCLLIAALAPAEAGVKPGYAMADFGHFAHVYNQHLKLDARFYEAFFPPARRGKGSIKSIYNYVKEVAAQAEGPVTDLPTAHFSEPTATMRFDLRTRAGKTRHLTIEISEVELGTLRVNDQVLDWRQEIPVTKRLASLREVLHNDYVGTHFSLSVPFVSEAEASAPEAIIVASAVAGVGAMFAHAELGGQVSYPELDNQNTQINQAPAKNVIVPPPSAPAPNPAPPADAGAGTANQ